MTYDETKVVKLGQVRQSTIKTKEQISEVADTATDALKEMAAVLAGKQDAGEAVQFVIPSDGTQWSQIVNYKYRLSPGGQLLDANNEKLIFTDDQGHEYTIMYEEGEFYKALPNGDFLEDENGLIVLSGYELFKYCDVSVQDLAVGDRVDVAIDPASMDAAADCGLSPVTESLDGVFRLFASDIPSGDISAQYWITRGKESATSSAYGVVNVSGKIDPASIGAVPVTRTINGKALSADISLSASDVGGVSADDLAAKQDVGEAVPFTIASGSFVAPAADETLPSPYTVCYDLPITGLTANDRVDVFIDPVSADLALTHGICPGVESMADKVRLLAVSAPAENISARYWITKGKSGVTSPAYGLVNIPKEVDATIPYLVGSGTATADTANYAVALGSSATAFGLSSTALGRYAHAGSNFSTALGSSANASGNYSTALGYGANVTGSNSTALGCDARTNGSYSTALGYGAKTNGSYSTALGNNASASGSSTALGSNTSASGSSTALGNNAKASGGVSISIGSDANASGIYSTALGRGAKASGSSSIALGDNAGVTGTGSTALGPYVIASGDESIALGRYAHASNNSSTALGNNASASGEFSISIGSDANASGYYSTAIGSNTSASGSSTALGNNAKATGESSTALGNHASASGNYSITLGDYAKSTGEFSTALGSSTKATGEFSTALGFSAKATGESSTALGFSANVSGNYSTALGAGAATANANSIQLGSSSSLSSITAKVGITVTSDERDKTDIEDIPGKATEFLKRIRAVTFVYNQRELYRPQEPKLDEEGNPIIEEGVDYLTDEDREKLRKYGFCRYDVAAHEAAGKKGTRRRVGFLAQDVQKAMAEVYGSASFANLVNDNLHDHKDVPAGIESTLAMNYSGFIPFLLKAFQELEARVTALETGVDHG